MQVSQSYGATRPAAIANRLSALRARFAPALVPVAATVPALIEVPAIELQTDVQTAPTFAPQDEARVPFVLEFPRQREVHVKAQRRMFASIKTAGLSMDLSKRLDGTNALLGLKVTSSTHLTPAEMHWVADAIGAGRFSSDWSLNAAPDVLDEDAPLPDAPPEVEPIETGTTPAPLESLDWLAVEFDLAQMRAADKARQRTAIYAEKILLETRLNELEHALLAV